MTRPSMFSSVEVMREQMKKHFLLAIPHSATLGMEFVDAEFGKAILKIPYKETLIGNPDNGVLHGGVITTLIDNVCGMAVFSALPEFNNIATLDLRIDYMKPAAPNKDLFAQGECYKLTRQIAFARAVAYQDNINDPIATSVSTFMRSNLPSAPHLAKKDSAT